MPTELPGPQLSLVPCLLGHNDALPLLADKASLKGKKKLLTLHRSVNLTLPFSKLNPTPFEHWRTFAGPTCTITRQWIVLWCISGIASSVLVIHVVLCSQHLTLRNPLREHACLQNWHSAPFHTHTHTHTLALIFGSYKTNLSVLCCPHNTNCVMTPYSVVGNLVSLFTALRHPLLRLGTVFIHHSRLWFFLFFFFFFQRPVPITRHFLSLVHFSHKDEGCLSCRTLSSVYQYTQSHDLDDHALNSHSHKNLKYNTIT